MNHKTTKLRVGGMTCVNCQTKIETQLRGTAGVERAEVSYGSGTAVITYDTDIVALNAITAVIERLDYKVLTGNEQSGSGKVVGILVIIAAAYMLLQQFGILQFFGSFQLAEAGTGYGMLFIIGVVTSVHCAAMCGGINLSQCITPESGGSLRPSALYNLGRVVSYTLIGAIVGAAGSVFSFSGAAKGAVQLIAGVFRVIMGLNMLNIFPWLRRLTPKMPKAVRRKIDTERSNGNNAPLVVGLLNGLMPCGPLQAMQLAALSSGSAAAGALSMFAFSLGTVPLMFGLGALSSVLSKKFTRNVMTVGAVLVVVLGLSMFTQGWSLSDFSMPAQGGAGKRVPQSVDTPQTNVVADGVQLVSSTLSSGRYPEITVEAGTPVRWTIDAPKGSVNGCNGKMFIPEYELEYKFTTGENIIEFTPNKSGTFRYSCWMGMIRSSITVTDPDNPET